MCVDSCRAPTSLSGADVELWFVCPTAGPPQLWLPTCGPNGAVVVGVQQQRIVYS